jgi:hypothetical protein
MTTTTSASTAPHLDARGADSPLPLGNVPFTTVIAGTLGDTKIPAAVGDSWRPVPASMLGLAPLAAVAAVTALSLMGGASAAPARHSAASTAHTCVTTPGALGQLKLPECLGD